MSAIVFMAGFAAAWWVMGVGLQAPVGLLAIGPMVSAAMILFARQRLKNAPAVSGDTAKRRGRIIGWAVAGEGVAIAVTSHLLVKAGLVAFVVPAVAIIVGLHFLPLAKLLSVKIYYVAGGLITLAGIAGLVVEAPHRALFTGLSAAVLLWLTCAYRLVFEVRSPTAAAAR
ncbi:hypothetical protein [Caulobacter sp. LARHSG274]